MGTRNIGNLFFIFCMICWILGVYGELCYEYRYDSWFGDVLDRSFYCTWGCCGTRYSGYCCSSSYYTEWSPVGAIVGGVIGGIVVLGIIIALCCACFSAKSKPGRVVAPSGGGQTHATVIMSQSHQQPSGYSYPPMPQYPYGTGQTGTSTNPGVPSSSGPDSVVPPPYLYSGPSGSVYPPVGGRK